MVQSWALGAESALVVGLRVMKVARGGAAARAEVALMVREKIEAANVVGARAMSGGLGETPIGAAEKTIAFYGKKVRANRRRLGK